MTLSHGQHRQTGRACNCSYVCLNICTEQIIVIVMAVSIQVRQLGNGIDNVVHATLEASENFTNQWKEGKTIYCSFTEIKRKIWAEYYFQIYSQIIIMDH